MKILIVEDDKKNISYAKKIFDGKEIKIVKTLKSAFKELTNNEYQILITDLYFSTGEIRFKKLFNQLLGDAILDIYQKCPDFIVRSENIDFAESIKRGEAEEVPSGVVLGVYSLLQKRIKPIWITSLRHHSSGSDFVNWFIVGPHNSNILTKRRLCRLGLIEDVDDNGIKGWDKAFDQTYKCKLSKEDIEEITNDKDVMNLKLAQFALRLPEFCVAKSK